MSVKYLTVAYTFEHHSCLQQYTIVVQVIVSLTHETVSANIFIAFNLNLSEIWNV